MSQSLLILKNLIRNEDYCRKVLPYIKEEYFHDAQEKELFKTVYNFINEHTALPTKEAIIIELDNNKHINDSVYENTIAILNTFDDYEAPDFDWLFKQTEDFCQMMAAQNAIMDGVQILTNEDDTRDKHEIIQLMTDALSVSFDPKVGHDFIDSYEERFDLYHTIESKISTGIKLLDKVMGGGASDKTLNMIMSPTGIGKSLCMCSMSAANLMMGKNVLYITMEMSEEKIAERIDANLFDIPINKIRDLDKTKFKDKIERIRAKTTGKLIIKEYPTGAAHAGHFRHLINELRIKKNFIPDILYIDYLNICASSRLRQNNNVNTYQVVKSIAEELRGLGVENSIPVWSATQTNRSGYNNSDLGLDNTAESFGLPATADFFIAIFADEEMLEMNQYMVKQLKNRYGDLNYYNMFVIGVDRPKMRLYDVETTAQSLIGQNIEDQITAPSASGESMLGLSGRKRFTLDIEE